VEYPLFAQILALLIIALLGARTITDPISQVPSELHEEGPCRIGLVFVRAHNMIGFFKENTRPRYPVIMGPLLMF
jgi:hypothetical protein